ncbi:phosphodiester glycosidase family protein, partial [Acinetobacter pittii]
FRCRLLHLEIILLKKPSRIALCNKAVIDGKINSLFLSDSQSKKIRNGVGIRDNKLYFVISKNRVNFYNFAEFFQRNLKVEQALYLDGSISSLYMQKNNRNDQQFQMGPIVGWVDESNCAVK